MLPENAIVDPKTKLLNVCCASLVGRPEYYSSTDETRGELEAEADEVCEQNPEFLLKAALYVCDDLNIRSTANFLLALAAFKLEDRGYLRKDFAKAVRLPTDLTEVVELYQYIAMGEGEGRVPMPTCLRIGKYQHKAGKKPKAVHAKGRCAWPFWPAGLHATFMFSSRGHAAGPRPGDGGPEDEAYERQLKAAGETDPHQRA
jgi:hypothetical protein